MRKYRWYAFIISGAYAAVGGALLAPAVGQVDPGLTYWTHSGTLVFMTLLGGFEHFFGPLSVALVYIFLQDKVMSLTTLLEVYLRRHSGVYRHCRARGYCWGDQFFGEKEKELNVEEERTVILSAKIFINITESSVPWAE